MKRPLGQHLWYKLVRASAVIFSVILFRVRAHGRHYQPPEGAVLVVANHQSHLDPPLIGMLCYRHLNFLARESLFHFFLLRWLIRSLGSIPIDRDGIGLSGIKETLRRLKRGEMVLVFPEGSRSPDGQVGVLKPGFCALARRGGVQVLPVAIAGAFEAWPRNCRFPRPRTVQIQFGHPLTPAQIGGYSDEELIAEIRRRLIDCHSAAASRLLRADDFHETSCPGS